MEQQPELTEQQPELTEKQLYMKEYYKNNRERILKTLLEPIHCNLCGKVINCQYLKKHQKTGICKRRLAKKLKIQNIVNNI